MSIRDLREKKDQAICNIADIYRELQTLKDLLERSARIIDSGIGAGILKHDPVQWVIDYNKTKSDE